MEVVFLLVGFILLIIGADKFVMGSSSLAKRMGIPPLVIGLTVVAFGTSAPELAVSLIASISGANEIAVGNVLGSNIFNLLMVVGVSSLIYPLVIDKELLTRDWVFSIISVFILGGLLMFDQELSRLDGVILLIGFGFVICKQVKSALKNKVVEESTDKELGNLRMILYIFLGLVGIIAGGQLTVEGATRIALMFNISETIIGLTIVAVGTSLPELVTSVIATKRKENSIAIGNVIGSNLFNVLFILGTSALISPMKVNTTAVFDTILLLIISVVLWFLAKYNKLNRNFGFLMILGYILYNIYIILR